MKHPAGRPYAGGDPAEEAPSTTLRPGEAHASSAVAQPPLGGGPALDGWEIEWDTAIAEAGRIGSIDPRETTVMAMERVAERLNPVPELPQWRNVERRQHPRQASMRDDVVLALRGIFWPLLVYASGWGLVAYLVTR